MENYKLRINEIEKKIKNKKIKIGIIGVGYVGIKLVIEFANKNFKIHCFDKDLKKLKKINSNIGLS